MAFPYKHVLMVGATTGIGKAVADRLIESGIKVTAVGRRQARIDEFIQKHGSNMAKGIAYDVVAWQNAPKFAEEVLKASPDIDCLFLNAGMQSKCDVARPETFTMDAVKLEFDTNFIGIVALANAFLPYLEEKSKITPSSIVITGTHLAVVPAATLPFYSASKGALNAYTLCLREQLKASGSKLKIIEIYPPPVQTELHNSHMGSEAGARFGMPIEEFTNSAWEGLISGDDEILFVSPGLGKDQFEEILQKRRAAFERLARIMRGEN